MAYFIGPSSSYPNACTPTTNGSRRDRHSLFGGAHPMAAEVGEPVGIVEVDVGQPFNASIGHRLLEQLRLIAPRPRVAHHHLEHGGPLVAGDDGPERGAERELDVG